MGLFSYNNSGGGSLPTDVFRGDVDANGEAILVSIDRDDYRNPPTGQYDLRCTGFSLPKPDPNPQKDDDGNVRERLITSLELEIISSKGKGFKFFWNYQTWSLGGNDQNPANLRRVYKAGVLKGAEMPKGGELLFDDLIGAEFLAYVVAGDAKNDRGHPTYVKLAKDTIAPISGDDEDPFKENNADAA